MACPAPLSACLKSTTSKKRDREPDNNQPNTSKHRKKQPDTNIILEHRFSDTSNMAFNTPLPASHKPDNGSETGGAGEIQPLYKRRAETCAQMMDEELRKISDLTDAKVVADAYKELLCLLFTLIKAVPLPDWLQVLLVLHVLQHAQRRSSEYPKDSHHHFFQTLFCKGPKQDQSVCTFVEHLKLDGVFTEALKQLLC